MVMDMREKVAYTALIALGVCLVVRNRKRLWEWLSSEPEPTYEPESYEAALFMDSSPNYDYELPID